MDHSHETTELTKRVEEFHRVFGHGIRATPGLPPEDRIRFHVGMIAEEFFELLEATFIRAEKGDFGGSWQQHFRSALGSLQNMIAKAPIDVDMPGLADACGDLDYVVESLRVAFGINGLPIAREIQRANMAKAALCSRCEGHGKSTVAYGIDCGACQGSGRIVRKRPEDGKVIKPEGWKPPDIAGELAKQGWSQAVPVGTQPTRRLEAIAERRGLTVDDLLSELESWR